MSKVQFNWFTQNCLEKSDETEYIKRELLQMKAAADTAQDLDEITASEQQESGTGAQETKISFLETRFHS